MTGEFFAVPGASFDLSSFNFQVPIKPSAARHSAAPTKPSARVKAIAFIFIFPPECEMSKGLGRAVGGILAPGRAGGNQLAGCIILADCFIQGWTTPYVPQM